MFMLLSEDVCLCAPQRPAITAKLRANGKVRALAS
jgi:hypothetical protein